VTKPNVLLLCGGASDEHEVSISSARSVINALANHANVTPLVIDRAGKLLSPGDSGKALQSGTAPAGSGSGSLAQLGANGSAGFDVVFPLLHGPNGEDGTVQGLLRLMNLPFVGSGVLASAVGMDKLMMKGVFAAAGLPQVEYRGIIRRAWAAGRDRIVDELRSWPLPLFVKPANLGSSVGISKVSDVARLAAAIDLAFRFDRRVIVEQGLVGAREIEAAVLGNDDPQVSPVGEIRYDSDFYDYETKYTAGHSELLIPAPIPDEVAQECRRLARKAFLAVDAAGLARVDFFYLEDEGRVVLNEINTMPGFTQTSMYPKLWEHAGIGYPELVRTLVQLALEER